MSLPLCYLWLGRCKQLKVSLSLIFRISMYTDFAIDSFPCVSCFFHFYYRYLVVNHTRIMALSLHLSHSLSTSALLYILYHTSICLSRPYIFFFSEYLTILFFAVIFFYIYYIIFFYLCQGGIFFCFPEQTKIAL